ncbi:MAG: metallophosphoesterase [Planctomycetes bacterium]|nr:metallophosphoesterase [Planctomycetota bacterium]
MEFALNDGVDLVLLAGDAYKGRDPTQTHQREFAKRLNRLSQSGIPTFLLVGNHDLPAASSRATAVDIFPTLEVANIYVGANLENYTLPTPSGPLQVLAVPWPRRSAILSRDESRGLSIEQVRQALYASKIVSYAQGFVQLREAAKEHDWPLDFGACALLWRGGCIIRAQFLDRIKEAFDEDPQLENLLICPYFTEAIHNAQDAWRSVVCEGVRLGLPMPAFTTALAYYDGYRLGRLPANLLQAQRDYFGAHTYRRTDKDGVYHTDWIRERKEPASQETGE